MSPMDGVAPPPSTLADRLTEPLAGNDDKVNAVHDALNAALPRLWWPLRVPSTDARLAAPHHVLYAVHAGIGLAALALITPRRSRAVVLVAGVALAGASWAGFTGAWDRRADQADSCERRAT